MKFCILFLIFIVTSAISIEANSADIASPKCSAADFSAIHSAYSFSMRQELPGLDFLSSYEVQALQQVKMQGQVNATGLLYLQNLNNVVGFLQVHRRNIIARIEKLRSLRRELKENLNQIAVNPSIKKKKVKIDFKIQSLQQDLAALAKQAIPLRNQLGLLTIREAALATAKQTNSLILLRNVLPNAAGQLAHKGVGKGLNIKFHSSQDGAIAGFLPYLQRLSKKVLKLGEAEVASKQKQVDEAIETGKVVKFPLRVGTMAAVERNGEVVFIDSNIHHIADSEIVEVIGVVDESQKIRPVVSDVDPLAFGVSQRDTKQLPTNLPDYGVVTESEVDIVNLFNQYASQFLGGKKRKFMSHGAENRNPVSAGVEGYPITAYYPDGRVVTIEAGPNDNKDINLKEFFSSAESQGFSIDTNPNWNW